MFFAANIVLITTAVSVTGYIVNPGPKYVATKGAIWPKPQLQNISGDYLVVAPRTFQFQANVTNCNLLTDAFQRYYEILQKNTINGLAIKRKSNPKSADEGQYLGVLNNLSITLNGPCDDQGYPTIDTDESYSLNVSSDGAALSASSTWGILRGLESFSQLVYLGNDGLTIRVNATTVTDYPRFRHRGLLLDTARHFIPIKQIHQIIDAMAYNKLNVFHWHIVDDQSFPYVSQKFPELSQYGAYNPELYIYTPSDVQEIIEYARVRGIRVLPEIDTPGHTRSWGVSHPEILTKCDQIVKGAYGPIDPTKNATYSIVKDLLSEFREVFKDRFVHLGGDEVDFDCWALDQNIKQFMEEHNLVIYAELEGYYIQKIIDIATQLNFSSVVWEEVFKNGVNLPNATIVHVWRDWEGTYWNDTIRDVTNSGKTALLSACWYLDHLDSGGDWEKFYYCEPTDFGGTPEQIKLVLGGEACMWAEVVNEYNVVQRIWPRASAVAEKLWSANEAYDLNEVRRRLEEHTCRMNNRGIPAQPPNHAGFCP